jgi:hypothetical protein
VSEVLRFAALLAAIVVLSSALLVVIQLAVALMRRMGL